MPPYSFDKRFATAVQLGHKRQTIRPTDRNARPGSIAHLFTGLRTTCSARLGTGVVTRVVKIEIGRNGCGESYAVIDPKNEQDAYAHLVHGDLDQFARLDGFENSEQLLEWFERKYEARPFKGWLHEWKL